MARTQLQAYLISIFLILVGIPVVYVYLRASTHLSPFKAGRVISKSPWALGGFFDASFGAVFAVLYVFLRNGPAVFCIPARLYAFIWPFLANFALLWYIAYVIIKERDLKKALLPLSDNDDDDDDNQVNDVDKRRHNRIIMIVASVMILFLICIYVWSWRRESIKKSFIQPTKHAWIFFTYIDLLAGICFVAVYMYAQIGPSITATLWIIALFILGNTVTAVYVILLAMRAIEEGKSFKQVLLSTKQTNRTGEEMPLQP